MYLTQGKEEAAAEHFKKAIAINKDVEYKKYNGLAKIYVKQKKYAKARELLEKSIKNYPYDDEARELLKTITTK